MFTSSWRPSDHAKICPPPRCHSSFSGNSSHRASILLAVHKVFTFASEELQKATSSGIKILPEIGAACRSDSAAPCRCPKPAPRPRKSVRGFRTWAKDDRLGNNRKYDQAAAEPCLLHCKSSDDYHGAYDRARLSTERQRLMNDWGKFCFSPITGN